MSVGHATLFETSTSLLVAAAAVPWCLPAESVMNDAWKGQQHVFTTSVTVVSEHKEKGFCMILRLLALYAADRRFDIRISSNRSHVPAVHDNGHHCVSQSGLHGFVMPVGYTSTAMRGTACCVLQALCLSHD